MILAVDLETGLKTLTSPFALGALAVLLLSALVASRGNATSLARGMAVCGWSLYVLTSPSSEFPGILHFIGPALAVTGVILDRLTSPQWKLEKSSVGLSIPTRLLFVYAAFAFLGCLASPYGPKNIFHWVETIAVLVTAFYGVSIGLARPLIAGTCIASFVNCLLALQAGVPVMPPGGGEPTRLGDYMQPNHLAFAAGIVIICVVWFAKLYPRFVVPLLGAGAICAYVLLATRSRASLTALVLGVAAYGLSSISTGRRRQVLLWVAAGLVVLGPVVIPAVATWFIRGSESSVTTLTGRTDFWPLVIHMIRERPIIGWGVNSVTSPPVSASFQAVTSEAIQAHNGFLEAALIGGIPGMLAWAGSLIGMLIGSLRMPRETPYRTLIVACTTVLLVESLAESNPAWQGDMFIVLALCAALYSEIRRRYVPVSTATLLRPTVRPIYQAPALAGFRGKVRLVGADHPPTSEAVTEAVAEAEDAGESRRPPWQPSRLSHDVLVLASSDPQLRIKDYLRRLRDDGHLVTRSTVATILGTHGLRLRSQRITYGRREREH